MDALNARKSPIVDVELSEYLAENDLNIYSSTDLNVSVRGADYVIVSTPTNYDEKTNFFDTSSVESVIAQVIESEPSACIVVKSTIPVGFIEGVRKWLDSDAVIFSPEFERSSHCQISVTKIKQAKIPKYGAVPADIARRKVEGLVDKPSADCASSNLASLGRYVLIPEIFDELRELSPGSGGEIQLSEGINSLAAKFGVEMVELKGKRFDCGSVEGYKDALLHLINE